MELVVFFPVSHLLSRDTSVARRVIDWAGSELRRIFSIAGWPTEGVYRCTKGMFIQVPLRGGLAICAIVECELELPVIGRHHLQSAFLSDTAAPESTHGSCTVLL